MKTFPMFDNGTIVGLQPCVKKAVVHAVQIDEDFRVDSLEGDYAQGRAGDYLMRGVKGELYICNGNIFEETYAWKQPLTPQS